MSIESQPATQWAKLSTELSGPSSRALIFLGFLAAFGLQTMSRGSLVRNLVLTVGLIAAFGIAVARCTSRTLPLPPPEVSRVTAPDADGLVTVTGYALEGASVGVVNDRTLEGVVVSSMNTSCDSTCPWEARLAARVGDGLRVWQFFETTGGKEVVVPDE